MPSRSAASSWLPAWWSAWLCCGLIACSPPAPQRFDAQFLAMGTQIELSILAESPEQAAALSAQVEQSLLRRSIDWYPWTTNPSGELRRLNAALAHGASFEASAALISLLTRAQQTFRGSDGYFDPAVTPMIAAWGMAKVETSPATSVPDARQLEQWQNNRPTLGDLRLSGRVVSSARRDLQLDLGAIAKGYAGQLAIQQLQSLGCVDAAINMGGQITVAGTALPPQLAAIAIRDPRAERALATLKLQSGESISTSGDYQRVVEHQGKRIHHLLDPHTGMPVTHTQAVTVISTDATLADAASTALMAAGPEHWQRIARQLGVDEVLRIDATGAIEVTAALYARLQWQPATQSRQIRQITL